MKWARQIWYASEILGWGGGALVAYSVVAAFTQVWPPLEAVARFGSVLLTVLGALLTATIVYFPKHNRGSWEHSRKFFAPVIIIACAFAIVGLFWFGSLPPVMVNGFSMLAIAGGLKRAIPYPQQPHQKKNRTSS